MSQATERLELSETSKQDIVYNEHIIRYQLASQLVAGKKVLDAACGSGYGSLMLAKAGASEVVGIDIDKETVEQAQQQYQTDNLKYLVDSAESLSKLEDNSFDIIVSFETIEHLKDYKSYLQALKRVLKPGGLVLISTPNIDAFKEVDNPYHLKEFTKEEFRTELQLIWPEVKLLDQFNALASLIKIDDSVVHLDSQAPQRVLYYIALCSDQDMSLDLQSVASFNQTALENWYNNPVRKLAIGLYKILIKLKIIKR